MSLKSFLVVFLFIFSCGLVIFFKEIITDRLKYEISDSGGADILKQLEHAPDFYLDDVNATNVVIDARACHFFNCFNIYRCVDHTGKQKKFHVHIPPPQRFQTKSNKLNFQEVSPLTYEYVEILEAVADSEYYTSDPDQACIFVPVLDLLNEFEQDPSQASKALEFASVHWKDSNWGENHLLFSFYPGSVTTG